MTKPGGTGSRGTSGAGTGREVDGGTGRERGAGTGHDDGAGTQRDGGAGTEIDDGDGIVREVAGGTRRERGDGSPAMRNRDVRGVSRILPDLDDDLLLQLFHKGARSQWTSHDLDSLTPLRLTPRQRQALARLLTPIYFGEQTAMAGASAILPQLMRARETSAQLYLASFIMDEARHFEVLTRLYRTLECDPLGLRDLPELLVYHHRLRQGDRIDWVWGILFSDLVGKHFYRAFAGATSDPFRTGATSDPFLAGLSTRILQDESRHLAFAEHYLRRNLASASDSRRRALLEMRDDLFRLLEAMTARVRADAAELELDADLYLGRVWADVDSFGRRIGLTAPPSEPSSDPPAEPPGSPPAGPAAASPDRAADAETRHAERHAQDDDHIGRHAERHADDAYHMGRHAECHAHGPERHAEVDRGAASQIGRHAEAGRGGTSDLRRDAEADRDAAYHMGRHAERHGEPVSASQTSFSACAGCVLALICGQRLALARA